MESLLESLRSVHVAAGFIGLAAFWVPVFSRKGGKNHRLFGKIFKYCGYVVLAAAALAITGHLTQALASGNSPEQNPSAFGFLIFLGYLTIVTFVILRHGVSVLNHKDISSLATPLNRALAWVAILASVGVIAYALYYQPPNRILLYALSPIGLLSGRGILKLLSEKNPSSKAWFYEHMGAMIGAGIAFHTAFAVFGSSRLFDLNLTGLAAVAPWILPTVIGIPATIIWTRYYRRKFGDLPA